MSESANISAGANDEVNTTMSERRMWLVKIPKSLADTWDMTPANSDLGTLRFTAKNDISLLPCKTPVVFSGRVAGMSPVHHPNSRDTKYGREAKMEQDKPKLDAHRKTELYAEKVKKLPEEYNFKATKVTDERRTQGGNLFVFSEGPLGGIAIEGHVTERADVLPKYSTALRNQSRDRYNRLKDGKRRAVMTDGKATPISMLPVDRTDNFQRSDKQRRMDNKRIRMPKDQLLDKIFKLFAKREHLKTSEISNETRQPASYLKEVLQEVAEQTDRGPLRMFWQLKPELRTKAADDAE